MDTITGFLQHMAGSETLKSCIVHALNDDTASDGKEINVTCFFIVYAPSWSDFIYPEDLHNTEFLQLFFSTLSLSFEFWAVSS